MLSRTFARFLLASLLLFPATTGRSSAVAVKFYPSLFSPAGHAHLLASFGEPRRARRMIARLNARQPDERVGAVLEVRLLTEIGAHARADSLLALVGSGAERDSYFRHYLQRGYLNLLDGRHARALELLAHTDSIAGTGLSAYRDFVRLRANLGLERAEAAVQAGRRAFRGDVPAPLSPDFELALVEALQMSGRPRDALGLVKRLQRRVRGSGEMAPLWELEYQLYAQADDAPAARKTAKKLARSYPGTAEAERVSFDVRRFASYSEMGSDELLAHAGAMTHHGRYREARAILRVLDGRRLSAGQREARSIVKARYYYHTGEYRRAAALSKPRFTQPANRRASMLILARSYRRLGKRRDAANVYSYFAQTYPNDAKAPEALYVGARLYERSGEPRKAQRALYELRKSYPSSYFGRMASWRGAAYYFQIRDYNRSVAILERAVSRSRRTDEAAMYYLATTYGKLGREEDKRLLIKELRSFDPFSFYLEAGVRDTFRRPPNTSTGEVALDGRHGLIAFLAGVSARKDAARRSIRAAVAPPDAGPGLTPGAAACLARGRWFLEVGFHDWGAGELSLASRRCLDSPAALLELGAVYDHYGLPWRSIRLYQRVKDSMHWKQRRALSQQFAYLMYPVPYPIQVMENAAQGNLPPHLVYAMIREESRFDRRAVSRVGALGLMQLMPETGRFIARELAVPELTEAGLLDPEVNIAFGIWYAASLYQRSGDDFHWMLAAYNAGPANANRWFGRRRSGAGTIELVDRIDFKETRRYVQRIVESANIYHTLYFDGSGDAAAPDSWP